MVDSYMLFLTVSIDLNRTNIIRERECYFSFIYMYVYYALTTQKF